MTMKTATIHLRSETLRIEIHVTIKHTDKACLPALTIDLEKTPTPYIQLSMTMGSWERPSGKGRWQEGCWGQARELVLESLDMLDSVNNKRAMTDVDRDAVRALCALWERWHLNDLKGGTRAQQEALASDEFKNAPPTGDYYDTASAWLAKKNLNPDRGYRYGQAWLVEPIPDSVLAEVETLSTSLGATFTEREDP